LYGGIIDVFADSCKNITYYFDKNYEEFFEFLYEKRTTDCTDPFDINICSTIIAFFVALHGVLV